MQIAVLRRRRRRIGAAAITPSQLVDVPYQKVVVGEAFSYIFAPLFANADSYALAPASPALPLGLTIAPNGDLAGTATVAAMNLIPVIRATNAASGLFIDVPFNLSAAQRPSALVAPVLSEPSAGVLRVAKPTIPANTPAVDHVDILYGLVNPPTLANATLVVDAFPVAATTFDIPDQAPGTTIYVTTRPAVAWGDGSFLYPTPPFSANVGSRLIATPIVNSAPVGANKALDFNIPAPDTTAPTLLSSSPADNATGVAPSATVTLTFSEAITLSATGTVTIREDAGSGFADWEVFDLATDVGTGAGKISASGAEVLLTPTIPMVAGRSYAVHVSAGAVKDTAGNAFAGIADDTTLNFAVAAAFSARSTSFNGTSSKLQSAGLSIVGGNEFTIAGWFKFQTWVSGEPLINIRVGTTAKLTLITSTTNRLQIAPSGATIFATPTNAFTAGVWQHVAISVRGGATPRYQFCVNGGAPLSGTPDITGMTLDISGATVTRFALGNDNSTNYTAGEFGHWWASLTQSLDLSDAAVRAKLISGKLPVDLGVNGENVTGSSPHFYLDGGASMANFGTGGALTATALSAGTTPALP